MLGRTRFPSVSLTKGFVSDALKASGFDLEIWRELSRTSSAEDKPAEYEGVFFLVARKFADHNDNDDEEDEFDVVSIN
jgi:hypothetical protein